MPEGTGPVAVVTGAGRGLGRAAALALVEDGHRVALVGRSPGDGPGTVTALAREVEAAGGQALACVGDVGDLGDVTAAVEAVTGAYGRIDVLVNNAGIFGPHVPTDELDVDLFDATVATNLRGAFLWARATVPWLGVRGGSIVNLSSLMAEHDAAPAAHVAYAVTKAGLNRMTTYLADELRSRDVAVNAVYPQGLRTEGAVESLGEDFDWSSHAPATEIGPVVSFLAAQRGSFTGRIVYRDEVVDGRYVDRGHQGARGSGPSTIEGFRDLLA